MTFDSAVAILPEGFAFLAKFNDTIPSLRAAVCSELRDHEAGENTLSPSDVAACMSFLDSTGSSCQVIPAKVIPPTRHRLTLDRVDRFQKPVTLTLSVYLDKSSLFDRAEDEYGRDRTLDLTLDQQLLLQNRARTSRRNAGLPIILDLTTVDKKWA